MKRGLALLTTSPKQSGASSCVRKLDIGYNVLCDLALKFVEEEKRLD